MTYDVKKAIEMQFRISETLARHYEMRIATEVYMERVGKVMDGAGRKLTAEEILSDEVATHLRHIHRMNELLDAYMTET